MKFVVKFFSCTLFLILICFCTACSLFTKPASPSLKAKPAPTPASLPEVEVEHEGTILDTEEYLVKLLGADPDNIFGYNLEVSFQNKTASKEVRFTLVAASINGVQSLVSLPTWVEPGQTLKDTWDLENLEKFGIPNTEYSHIELLLEISDATTDNVKPLWLGKVHIYPQGKNKASHFTYQVQESDRILMDNDLVTVLYTGADVDDASDMFLAHLVLINKTDNPISLVFSDYTLNGRSELLGAYQTLWPKNTDFMDFNWTIANGKGYDLKDLSDVKKVQFTIEVRWGEYTQKGETVSTEKINLIP